MTILLTIGDFSRMTYISVKALRHYHELGLLEPARIDPTTGYRSYDAGQFPDGTGQLQARSSTTTAGVTSRPCRGSR
jgi:hypothetical protein